MSVIRDIVAKINTTRLVYEPLTLAVRKSKSPTVSFIGILDGQIFRKNPQNPALSPPPLRAPYSVRATDDGADRWFSEKVWCACQSSPSNRAAGG